MDVFDLLSKILVFKHLFQYRPSSVQLGLIMDLKHTVKSCVSCLERKHQLETSANTTFVQKTF